MMINQNLSEKLFKPKLVQTETSTLVSYNTPLGSQTSLPSALNGSQQAGWYRMINRPIWIWRGVDAMEIEDVLSRIAASTAKRSDPALLDTVIGNRRGNWCFEWSYQAMNWQQKALEYENGPEASHAWAQAANLYSIAAYPFIKGDELADQAVLLACKAYENAARFSNYQLKKVVFPLAGSKEVAGFLHIPSVEKGPYPTVLVCGFLDSLQIDYCRFFREHLEPKGIAMLTLDMPSIGYSIKHKLTQDTSELHQQVINQLGNIPWIDHTRVGLVGIRFGANVALRLAYMEPSKIKAVAVLGPVVHSLFHDDKQQNILPRMELDVLASRLGIYRVNGLSLRHELGNYSLKNQGFFRQRSKVPFMSVCWKDDIYSPKEESLMITRASVDGNLLSLPATPVFENYQKSLTETANWLTSKIV